MKLLRIGNVILNMDQVLAIQDLETELILFFTSPDSAKPLTVPLKGDLCQLMRVWLGRSGVNDLSTENPEWNWVGRTVRGEFEDTDSHKLSS